MAAEPGKRRHDQTDGGACTLLLNIHFWQKYADHYLPSPDP
jgi:hypothetical protein